MTTSFSRGWSIFYDGEFWRYSDSEQILDDSRPCKRFGSGTTAIAAINTKRNYIGFEFDTTYCDIANKRIQDIVKK